jgi:hypothetical protein
MKYGKFITISAFSASSLDLNSPRSVGSVLTVNSPLWAFSTSRKRDMCVPLK